MTDGWCGMRCFNWSRYRLNWPTWKKVRRYQYRHCNSQQAPSRHSDYLHTTTTTTITTQMPLYSVKIFTLVGPFNLYLLSSKHLVNHRDLSGEDKALTLSGTWLDLQDAGGQWLTEVLEVIGTSDWVTDTLESGCRVGIYLISSIKSLASCNNSGSGWSSENSNNSLSNNSPGPPGLLF